MKGRPPFRESPQSWHALFAPLPADAIPDRKPVAPPEILATPAGASIAGWEQVTIDLSAGPAGSRVVLLVLDATGRPISASDMVLYRSEVADGVEYRQESVGGRLEADGTFRGTRWRGVAVERAGEEDSRWDSTPSEPSAADVAGIRALVSELLRRLPPRSC